MTHSAHSLTIDDLVAPTDPSRATDHRPYGDRARVLSRSEDHPPLQDVPVAVCCPNCGQAVTIFERGLTPVVPHFETACRQCEIDIRTWCAVAVDAAYLEVVEPATLTAMVQQFWDHWLWSGITNSKDEPRTDEYTDRFASKADAFGWDWDVTCPLCRRTRTELESDSAIVGGNLDYHYWSHNPDRGICLCRECHDIIGFDTDDTELEEWAESWGFDSRHALQISRLLLRDALVTGRRLGPWDGAALVDRYNLPQSTARVTELIRALRTTDELQDQFIDDRLADGVSTSTACGAESITQ